MKKSILLLGTLLFFACSDGDLQIETLDFDSVGVQFCGTVAANAQNVLFKINGDEALILTLQSGALNNGEIGAASILTTVALSTQTQLRYRIFSDNVTANYFCDDFPPTEPVVTEEVLAQDGEILINTVMNADATAFIHTIELSNITLVNSLGERITDLTINNFGEVTTAIE